MATKIPSRAEIIQIIKENVEKDVHLNDKEFLGDIKEYVLKELPLTKFGNNPERDDIC